MSHQPVGVFRRRETPVGCATVAPPEWPRMRFRPARRAQPSRRSEAPGCFGVRREWAWRPRGAAPSGQGPASSCGAQQQLCASAAPANNHQTLTPALRTGRRHRVAHRVQIGRPLRRRPVDADIDDFAQWFVQSVDEPGQFSCHRTRVRPPCPIDITAQERGQSDPHGTTTTTPARQTVHDDGVVPAEALASGRSEKVGCSTGPVEVSPEATISGSWG
jgi:hypothetical protein